MAALAVLNSLVFDWQVRRLVGGVHLNRFYLESFRWPRVTGATLNKLARAGVTLSQQNRRYAEIKGTKFREPVSTDFVDANVSIEHEVALGFGLTRSMLSLIFDDGRRDRRGFWRYFEAEPRSREVVRRVLAAYPRTQSTSRGRLSAGRLVRS